MAQVISLNLIFTALARRSLAQTQVSHLDIFLRLALKAQNQCRMTLETLATIKNPPVLFARQANINNGGQLQVNNDAAPSQTTRAAKTETSKTELLEASDDKRLDTGTQGAAGGADPHMETVGAGHRAAHG